ncbi:cystatin-9-like [Erinaceus europaeus]|uniref:Cystatin-9-like n=1 Tax=Erinaceus europaeus TaxID=9365 RepID=A0A1S3A5Y4_ERIEU|nr:cystatin-9-like [Erinaceus europaeus]
MTKALGTLLPTAMLCQPQRWALLSATLLLLLEFQVLVTRGKLTEEEDRHSGKLLLKNYLPATVEYAMHMFNLESKDINAYRLTRILNSWKEPDDSSITFSMVLLLRRTECGKFEDNIDNCQFETNQELNKEFNCFFTITTEPWKTLFKLQKKICSEIPL